MDGWRYRSGLVGNWPMGGVQGRERREETRGKATDSRISAGTYLAHVQELEEGVLPIGARLSKVDLPCVSGCHVGCVSPLDTCSHTDRTCRHMLLHTRTRTRAHTYTKRQTHIHKETDRETEGGTGRKREGKREARTDLVVDLVAVHRHVLPVRLHVHLHA